MFPWATLHVALSYGLGPMVQWLRHKVLNLEMAGSIPPGTTNAKECRLTARRGFLVPTIGVRFLSLLQASR